MSSKKKKLKIREAENSITESVVYLWCIIGGVIFQVNAVPGNAIVEDVILSTKPIDAQVAVNAQQLHDQPER